ncbi:hypothetical protein K503DRAFT_774976 [Rhizopogon vinicolor AM-OR11-026]|uniref:Uncharacterized protein n=1 Tax=Rhizopogon vinicolor AM-OR11-026 TaxID=1314800 RepID=A0A1B7MN70_9AGAM|nr:hypothetical protein K503DRAFT_774976 [Rhizopogon vinicolor AM-OR11-026]
MTLPVFAAITLRQTFIDIFDSLHLPMLQELALLGELGEPEVAHAMAALGVVSYHVRVVDFRWIHRHG